MEDNQLYMSSGTIDVMEEPHVRLENEEHSNLQVLEEKIVMEDVGKTLFLHQEDHELPLWERDLVMEEEDEHSLYEPDSRGVYASMYLVDRCMKGMDTHWGQSIPTSVQSCEQQQRHIWLLTDAFIIHGKT